MYFRNAIHDDYLIDNSDQMQNLRNTAVTSNSERVR